LQVQRPLRQDPRRATAFAGLLLYRARSRRSAAHARPADQQDARRNQARKAHHQDLPPRRKPLPPPASTQHHRARRSPPRAGTQKRKTSQGQTETLSPSKKPVKPVRL